LTVFEASLVFGNSLGDIVVFPLKGFGGLVIEADVAQDLAGQVLGVEGSLEREGAVAQVLESMALGSPRRQGKTPVGAV